MRIEFNRFVNKPLVKVVKDYIERTTEMIFPPKCIFCSCILEPGQRLHICHDCYLKIPFSSGDLLRPAKRRAGGCDCAVCVCSYSGIVKSSLIRFKFFNKPGYYRTFARLLCERLSELVDMQSFDLIVSVPLHKERQRSRGYNQAALLADELSLETGIPKNSFLLSRVRSTEVQSLLPGSGREQNVKNAFKVNNASVVRDKAILLVDDVMTTGSTLDECSRVLKQAGAGIVTAVVIATGRKY